MKIDAMTIICIYFTLEIIKSIVWIVNNLQDKEKE